METIFISSRQKALEKERLAMQAFMEEDPLMRRVFGGPVFTDPVYMAVYINRACGSARTQPSGIHFGDHCAENAGE